jgi:hypothetical protein
MTQRTLDVQILVSEGSHIKKEKEYLVKKLDLSGAESTSPSWESILHEWLTGALKGPNAALAFARRIYQYNNQLESACLETLGAFLVFKSGFKILERWYV